MIYIFGAGNYAKKLFFYFYFKRQCDRVKGFLVTSLLDNPDYLFEKRVFEINEVEDLSEADIYLGVTERKQKFIKEELQKNGAQKIVELKKDFFKKIPRFVAEECARLPIQRNKIFFDSFNGGGYSCNCKYIAENLLRENQNLDIVWNVAHGESHNFPAFIRVIERENPQCYEEYFTAAIIVSNAEYGMDLPPRKEQYVIHTWHGTGPFKKIGIDVSSCKGNDLWKESVREQFSHIDLGLAASAQCSRNYRKAFLFKGEILKSGYPRNDIFFQEKREQTKIREVFELPAQAGIVLYAPTFRPASFEGMGRETYDVRLEQVKESLERKFQKRFFSLYRFHHQTYRAKENQNVSPEGIDVTFYPDMQELLVAADVLITDWSSSICDFALTRKPIFLYYHDADEVERDVGFYRHPDTYPFPKGHTTEELCAAIESFDDAEYQKGLDEWFAEYKSYDDGHASERVVSRILDVMEHPEKYGKA